MSQDNWWALQFTERVKEMAHAYDKFYTERDVINLDYAEKLFEELNDTYEMDLDFEFYVELGRALLRNSPQK